MEVAREKVSGPETGEVNEDSGEKSTRMWRKKRVKGREENKEKGTRGSGKEEGEEARKNRREVVDEGRCVVEPERGCDNESGGGEAEETYV